MEKTCGYETAISTVSFDRVLDTEKHVADGWFDRFAVDKQTRVAAMLLQMRERGVPLPLRTTKGPLLEWRGTARAYISSQIIRQCNYEQVIEA